MKPVLLIGLLLISCNKTDSLIEKGNANLVLGDYKRARHCFAEAVDHDPNASHARLGLGKALFQEYCTTPEDGSLLMESLVQLEAARSLMSEGRVEKLLSRVWLKRTHFLLMNADTTEALKALSRSTSLDPRSGNAVNLAGVLCFYQGENEKALTLFKRVITIDSSIVSGYFNAGMVCWADSNYADAYQYWFAAARHAPEDVEILSWVARAKRRLDGGAQ
ncbi:MAG: tetratricopeptide repeat protein [Chitinispirillaceae bacterium]|nr:tetratricopeptide repeat protein [Chitinispirillaceae bacterium]